VPITYVHSAYEDTISDTATEIVAGPCSLLGIIVTPTKDPDGDATVTFYNGNGVTELLKTNLGDATAGSTDSQSGVLWSPLPGMGIRFDSSLWVKCSVNGDSSTRIAAVTVFYQ